MRTMGGDHAAVRKLAVVMRSDMAERRERIHQALDSCGMAKGQEHIHALKGALASISAHPAAKLAKQLELAWPSAEPDALRALLDTLDRELLRVDAALEKIVAG